MTVETATYISDLNSSYPEANSAKSQGDDHLRLIKTTVKATFPNVAGAVTPTHTELNYVDGVTSAIQTQIDAKAPSASPTITGSPTAAGATWTSLGTVTTADINGGTIDGTTIGGASAAAGTFTSLSDSGNLTFTGTGNRITGDFSNATVANRVMFQTSTTNDITTISAVPNGTGIASQFLAYNSATPVAATPRMRIGINSTISYIVTDYDSGGSYLPMTFYTGGSERMRVHTSGGGSFGTTTDPGAGNFQVSGTVVAGSAFSFRNKIIGGDFTTNPWQRGTSFTTVADNTYTADRFLWKTANTTGVVSILKTADAPTASEAGVYSTHCLHIDVTTADASVGATDSASLRQIVEGYNAAAFGFGQSGTRYVTLSFWHKHTKTGTYCVAFKNNAQDRSYIAEYTQAVTDTWEKATITIPVDTSGTWLYDSGVGLRIDFAVINGSTFQTAAGAWTAGAYWSSSNQVNALDSTSNNFKIALVQLEAGTVATPFETRPYGTELALCQRYYFRVATTTNNSYGPSANDSTSTAVVQVPFPIPMRTSPTAIEQSGTAGDYAVRAAGGTTACTSVPTFNAATPYSAQVTFTTGATLTSGQAGSGRSNSANSYLGWSAEL